MSAAESGPIRWEAWSHRQIYTATQTGAAGRAYSLATTVAMWREIVADLGEVRARYEAAVDRLTEASSGSSADAAGAKSQLVTRGLTEAQERAGLAGAKRARLHELNEHLRRTMPKPDVPAEESSTFLDRGLGWLTPPDFHGSEAERHNAEERARDLMRAYEQDISTEALTANAHNSAGNAAHAGLSGDEPIIPLFAKLIDEVAPATAQPAEHGTQPPAWPGHERHTGGLGMITRNPPYWAYADFGPQGHDHLEHHDDHDHGGDDGGSGRAAGGAIPTSREDGDYYHVLPSRVSDSPFDLDIKAIDGAIGE